MNVQNQVRALQAEIQKARLTPAQIEQIREGIKISPYRIRRIQSQFEGYLLCDQGAEIICEIDCSKIQNAIARLRDYLQGIQDQKTDLLLFLEDGNASD